MQVLQLQENGFFREKIMAELVANNYGKFVWSLWVQRIRGNGGNWKNHLMSLGIL